ncbi:hypothetical protein ACJJTC_002320 [Scirpophaga incertulas]
MLTTMIVLVLLSLGVIENSVGHVVQDGQCDPNVELAQNFNINMFLGDWREHATLDPDGADCVTYKFEGAGNSLTTQRHEVYENFANSRTGAVTHEAGTSKLTINYTDSSEHVNFWILAANLNYFTVAYGCDNISPTQKRVSISVLTRPGQTLTSTMEFFIDTRLRALGYSLDSLNEVSHSNDACYVLPVIAPKNPIILEGQCDENINVVQNFNIDAFTGVWHETSSYYSENSNNQCSRAEYTLKDGVVNVVNSQVVNQELDTITGTASVVSNDGSARLKVDLNVNNDTVSQELLVLATDYTNYAISYTCVNLADNKKRVYSWILSRRRQLTASAQADIDKTIASEIVLNKAYYQDTARSDNDCFYYPEPVPNTPVVFRGSCDKNIPVVQNFDLEKYTGVWHYVESYPNDFDIGSCQNAIITLNGQDVSILTTEVVNQQLLTMQGIGDAITEDGSGKYKVTFPSTSQANYTGLYYVLAADYTSYALIYSCEDLEETEERQVRVWKLSRTKQLSQEANAAISATMANNPVLNQQYFEPVDQRAEACFYYPEPQEGVVVEFRGTCDNNINVIQDFNLARFSNIWYEVEAYPRASPFQVGVCINHKLSVVGNSTELETSQVLDQLLDIEPGSLRYASNDNSGKLIFSLPHLDLEIPFWIISTDYDNYAVAYSCVQRGEDVRAVYSWKFSRTKVMSEESKAAISAAIADVDVLQQQYYNVIDQSDEACFYLPDLEKGEPVILFGSCDPNIPVIPNFRPADYAGTWRLIESYPSEFHGGTCNEATYDLNANGTIKVFNTQVEMEHLITETGSATISDNAKLLVTLPTGTMEYWILDTDYETYSLVYSCDNMGNDQRRVWSWKLSRTRSLPPIAIALLNEKIDQVNVLNNRYYVTIDQTDASCFYYPEVDSNTPLKFRGKCDQNIQAVSNFNMERYLGLWHNIELYPSNFQKGTCHNARYSQRNDGSVDVFNTQVVNQALDVMTGQAVVASTDGSGKLSVTFPVAGTNTNVTMDYLVLATDYDTYSLVYTCEDVEDDHRMVYSWKLSKTKQLSPQASTAMDNVIRGIKVLDERYYFDSNQTPEGCFYHPVPQPGLPVRYPGQCSADINVVQDFNLTRFDGTWYEIEAYPTDQQQGQCISHLLSPASDRTLNLQSSQVSAQTLISNTGVLSFDSASSNDARMTVRITVDGQAITIPFWILSTDYDDYALAYSCVNENSDYRHVYSWKLSRRRTLSETANNNINKVIATVDILGEQYYEKIDQAPEACFYFPDLNPGDPVIFPGQCDESIPAVNNFEAARYLNRWRTIQSYASEFEGGTCGQATYSLSTDGQTIDVHNTQVVDEALDEIRGTAVLASTDGSGKLLVSFPTAPEPANYWILATDYNSYALVYSCRNIDSERRQVWAWKLSRDATLSTAANTAINAAMNNIDVLDNRYFETMDQSEEGCFYYPVMEGLPIRFRGRCNENIPVVTNFDIQRYAEHPWYDIESYPQRFQFGTCPTAQYSVNETEVGVVNTQVVDQELDTMIGTAVVASNDGSAKLSVTFPVAGTNETISSPYWVLDTDYSSYSLVYSCQNIDDEYYGVTSWKLSRTRELSAEQHAAISNTMASVKVLRQQYYVPQDHTAEGCFFYPNNNGGSVIWQGQCDKSEDIETITNFNRQEFAGTWYEVEHIPSELQSGKCIADKYEASQTGFNLTKTVINREQLITYTTEVMLPINDKAMMSVTLPDGQGQYIDINLYVLATDYNSYALLYGCKNINAEEKQVYSYKLSKSESGLTASAIESINEAVLKRDDITEKYFEKTARDNDDCFYYPDYDGTESVIRLPGPCPAVSGVANFNAENYLGRWYEVARYPEPSQDGACNQATYSLGDGVVDVLNTQVVNALLETQEGSAVVASADNTGQLTVTFVVDGETRTATYYVLATDYDSYSLVYSCRNTNDGWRNVFSWKLSRSKTLSTNANTAINNVVGKTQGLKEDYYRNTDQGDDACFYVPKLTPGQEVRFRGRCEQYTGGMQNLDSQKYLSQWWHEIERYTSNADGGSCVSTRYQQSNNQISFTETRVFSIEDGKTSSGTVVAGSNGQIVKSFADGTSETLWVLATDYDSYALLLSCQDIDDEYMRVWSTKQSRSRSLAQTAQDTLTEVINDNKLLYAHLYQPVSQADDDCFYYPERQGQRIILPGRCDSNIPVQTNFNITSYTGTWYQIQRYPYPEMDDDSRCIGVRYTLPADSDVIEVVSWENVEDEVKSVEGTAVMNEGGAVMEVTLNTDPENNVTSSMNLYVLSTDYVSYSLVYTCTNFEEYHRIVVAAKLSRTRSLVLSAETAINAYMAPRQEFNQKYFIQVEHDEECKDPSSAGLIRNSFVITLVCLILRSFL